MRFLKSLLARTAEQGSAATVATPKGLFARTAWTTLRQRKLRERSAVTDLITPIIFINSDCLYDRNQRQRKLAWRVKKWNTMRRTYLLPKQRL
jgi:hypothetical protein